MTPAPILPVKLLSVLEGNYDSFSATAAGLRPALRAACGEIEQCGGRRFLCYYCGYRALALACSLVHWALSSSGGGRGGWVNLSASLVGGVGTLPAPLLSSACHIWKRCCTRLRGFPCAAAPLSERHYSETSQSKQLPWLPGDNLVQD